MSNHSLADHNRDHWDKMAHQYDTKDWQKVMIAYITKELRANTALFGIPNERSITPFRLLDYACGPGTITRAFAPYVTTAVGIDVSPVMVRMYNERAGEESLLCKAYVGDLFAEPAYVLDERGEKNTGLLSDEEFNEFDSAVVGFGFHHFENYVQCLDALAKCVKSDGRVGVVDLLPDEGHLESLPGDMQKMMYVSGFTQEQMKGYMLDAGLENFEYVVLPEKVYMEIHGNRREKAVFFASGRKV